MNRVILVGNIVRDPEIKVLSSGNQVANTSLVTNNRYKAKDGTRVDDPSFHNLSVYGPQAAIFNEYVKKGAKLYVEGALRYTPTEKDGVKGVFTSIIVDKFNFISGPASENSENRNSKPVAKQKDYFDSDIPF